jgi:hypothetical protein
MQSFPSRCQHIKVNGTQCGCPALRRNKLCYFHKRHHEERVELNLERLKDDRARRRRNVTIELPVLEDANSIQISLMQIMRLIIAGQIDGKSAGLLLYALQTASANLHRTSFEPYMHNVVLDPRAVDQTPLGAYIWEDSDFIQEDEEANRLTAEGAREREAARRAEAATLALEAEQERKHLAARAADAAREHASPTAAITAAGRAVVPPKPTEPSPGKRPPANVNMNEVRKQVRDQIRKQLPAIAAAQSGRNHARSSG